MTIHKWITIAMYSPDLQPVGRVITNGYIFFVVNHLSSMITRCKGFDDAMDKLVRNMFCN